MFAALKQKLSGTVAKFKGNKDFLEAVCAAAALVASADGDVSNDEIDTTIKAITSNATLSANFSVREIESTADTMLKRASGRVGQNGLYKEIEEALAKDKTGEMAETILLTALDVADNNGIDAKEKEVLVKIAGRLRLDLNKYI